MAARPFCAAPATPCPPAPRVGSHTHTHPSPGCRLLGVPRVCVCAGTTLGYQGEVLGVITDCNGEKNGREKSKSGELQINRKEKLRKKKQSKLAKRSKEVRRQKPRSVLYVS